MPRLLDLFCKAGGASMGYHRAGWQVVGVDIEFQPRYPFEFIQADALEVDLDGFDAYHASPPCERWNRNGRANHRAGSRAAAPDLIAAVRERLERTGRPWIMENVPGSPLLGAVEFCGLSFGQPWFKHRCFESNVFLLAPPHVGHEGKRVGAGYYGVDGAGHSVGLKKVFGCDWMTLDEVRHAVPPVYTQLLGQQLKCYLDRSCGELFRDPQTISVAGV